MATPLAGALSVAAGVDAHLWAAQVPTKDMEGLASFLDELGYPYFDETENPVFENFLR